MVTIFVNDHHLSLIPEYLHIIIEVQNESFWIQSIQFLYDILAHNLFFFMPLYPPHGIALKFNKFLIAQTFNEVQLTTDGDGNSASGELHWTG